MSTLIPDQPDSGTPKRFYGWVIVAVSFVQLTFAAGLGFYGLPVFLKALNQQRGFAVSTLSLATSCFWIAVAVTGVFTARAISLFDPRWVIVAGALVGGVSIALIGRVTAVWQLFPLYIAFGAGFTGTAVLVANTVLTRWFHQKRSMAISIATTGLSVGGIVLTPIITSLIDERSLSSAMAITGLLFFVGVAIPSAIFIRASPETKGQYPDGATAAASSAANQSAHGSTLTDAKDNPLFWVITATFALGLLAQVGGISQLVKLASERAGSPTDRQIVSVLAACSVFGRLSGGYIVTKMRSQVFAYGALLTQASGLLVLSVAEQRSFILFGACLFGLGVGNVLLLHPLLLAEHFGVRDYGKILGHSSIFVSIGNAVGPFAMGFTRDNLGGYTSAYLLAAALNILGFSVLFLRGAKRTPQTASA